jgi:hypothetical protein
MTGLLIEINFLEPIPFKYLKPKLIKFSFKIWYLWIILNLVFFLNKVACWTNHSHHSKILLPHIFEESNFIQKVQIHQSFGFV